MRALASASQHAGITAYRSTLSILTGLCVPGHSTVLGTEQVPEMRSFPVSKNCIFTLALFLPILDSALSGPQGDVTRTPWVIYIELTGLFGSLIGRSGYPGGPGSQALG